MTEYISLKSLSEELKLDRSNLRKYVLKHGFTTYNIRTHDSRNQTTLALQLDDAESIRDLRKSQGFVKSNCPVDNNKGFFYIIQLVPELNPLRVKLGFATDVLTRLSAHQTAAPTAKLIKSWKCKRTWEIPAIECITQIECVHIANEVYECKNLYTLTERADNFFYIMPKL